MEVPKRRLGVIAALSLALLASEDVIGQRYTQSLPAMVNVATILDVVFPDVGDRLLTLRIHANLECPGCTSFQAWDTEEEPKGTGMEHERALWLSGHVKTDRHGLVSLVMLGRATHADEEAARTRRLVDEGPPPDWAASLEAAGAKYPPKAQAAFLRWVRSLNWEHIFGKARLTSVEFAAEPSDSPSYVLWAVVLRAADGTVFDLFFEPYGGRLVSARRRTTR